MLAGEVETETFRAGRNSRILLQYKVKGTWREQAGDSGLVASSKTRVGSPAVPCPCNREAETMYSSGGSQALCLQGQ